MKRICRIPPYKNRCYSLQKKKKNTDRLSAIVDTIFGLTIPRNVYSFSYPVRNNFLYPLALRDHGRCCETFGYLETSLTAEIAGGVSFHAY